jgi:Kef-type K+ transport system membrane component KefB
LVEALLQNLRDNPFYEVAILLLIAAVVGAVAVRLRQPLIIGFIAVGILVGPVLGLVTAHEQIDLLAELGISLLLFIVGLRLDLNLIRTMGPVALATGLGQVVSTSVVGFFIALALGFTPVNALYIAVALTFSSTIIIVKLLSDKQEIDSLHGRIAIGLLIVQDIVVVLAMITLTAFGGGEGDFGGELLQVALRGAAFLATIGLLMRYVLPSLLRRLASSPELLVVFSIAWAVALAAAGDFLGFSKEIGAFLAGVSLGSTEYREAIGSRLTSLRDFLLLFFFISLGSEIELGLLGEQIVPGIVLSLFVLIGKPLIVLVIIGLMGYRRRVGFLAGLTMAQISEFSLIFAGLALSLGYIDADTLGLITLVGLITISLSAYMILYSHVLYERLSPYLRIFERDIPHPEDERAEGVEASDGVDVIIFGLGRYGSRLAERLQRQGVSLLGVDFDPEAVERWHEGGMLAHYGDAEDPEFPASLPLGQAKWVVSSVAERSVNLVLLDALHRQRYKGKVAVIARVPEDVEALEKAGADVVFRPYLDAADRAAEVLTNANTELGMFVSFLMEELDKGLGELTVEDISLYREHLTKKHAPVTAAKKLEALQEFLFFENL